jgi:hypothetical protein
VGWQEETVIFGPSFTSKHYGEDAPYEKTPSRDMAINAGLRALGLAPAPGQDEHTTIGLEQHRWAGAATTG